MEHDFTLRRPTSKPGLGAEHALRLFHSVASAYFADAGDLSAVRQAVQLFAEAGRAAGSSPEELVVMLKHRCSVLPTSKRRDAAEDDRLKDQFVTWLVDAYFGGRAD